MVILIGGSTHTGKTLLAQKLVEKYHYSCLSLDHLKMGLIRSGNTELTPNDDDKLTGYLWPIVCEMIKTVIENGQSTIIEGCYFPYDWQRYFNPEYLDKIKMIFLIFSPQYIEEHFDDIRKFGSVIEDRIDDSEWCTKELLLRDNKVCHEMCQKHNCNYIMVTDQYNVEADNILFEMDTIYQNSSGSVSFVGSEEYGNAVLKINRDTDDLISEYHALMDFAGERCCSVYEFSEREGHLLEERIIPGSTLREENSFLQRLDEFVQLFLSIHPIQSDREYNTYLQWIQSAAKFCESNHKVKKFKDFLPIFGAAKTITRLAESFFKQYESVLLHGDLHHDNILKKSTGIYCMIDPKGVIGPAIFDVGRFLLNEIDCATEDGKKDHLIKTIQVLGEKLSFPEEELFQILYIEAWLACVWDLEDGNPPEAFAESFILAEKLCRNL